MSLIKKLPIELVDEIFLYTNFITCISQLDIHVSPIILDKLYKNEIRYFNNISKVVNFPHDNCSCNEFFSICPCHGIYSDYDNIHVTINVKIIFQMYANPDLSYCSCDLTCDFCKIYPNIYNLPVPLKKKILYYLKENTTIRPSYTNFTYDKYSGKILNTCNKELLVDIFELSGADIKNYEDDNLFMQVYT